MVASPEVHGGAVPDGVVIIGAGPAGLTAAYMLAKQRVPVTVLEADPQYLGGISRTFRYKGFCFDIGGHRFFSKSKRVEDFWTEVLPDDMLDRPRSSRIFYNGRFFSYPLKPVEALWKLGAIESALCVGSYLKATAFPNPAPASFEDWVTNQFGSRLYSIFFKTYTEKVWGMSCKEISADWAAQRIQGLSLGKAVSSAFASKRSKKNAAKNGAAGRSDTVKTLIESFRYPRQGPGMMWDACAARVAEMGGRVLMGQRVEACTHLGDGRWQVRVRAADGTGMVLPARHVISSAPLAQLVHGLAPEPAQPALQAASALRYRDFLTVGLILRDRGTFPDNWIYVHDKSVKVGRVQNYKSWSPEMSPDPAYCGYGLEYFCFEGDGLWNSSDADLIELAKSEVEKIGLARREDVVDGCVIRQPKAYPVYDDSYARHVETIRLELEHHYPGLHLVGRNGMHKYNNQDHSMMTAMLTAENILAGSTVHDVWRVNQDAEYHESGTAGESSSVSGLRSIPARASN